jgi:hypothetical protein
MTNQSPVPPGWVGGFAESDPSFAYPDPDLTSLPMLCNMANIGNIKRQQEVLWPEFSWETIQGETASRCFQMFAPDISRLGYDDTGRVWSIICPQQGVVFPSYIVLNVEVTVTGQRGWADETDRELAADMTVTGKIWFSPSANQNIIVKTMWDYFKDKQLPFPSDKSKAIEVTTHKVGSPGQPIFPLRKGESPEFVSPDFARHPDEAWTVGNLGVQIGPIKSTGYAAVDTFNQKVLDLFNLSSGNMLQLNNVLTWNVWFAPPQLVDTEEWRTHAEKWRESIDADHGPNSSPAKFADGSLFKPAVSDVDELERLLELVKEVIWSN